jgi:nitrate reductase gamma subunit
MLDKNSPVTGFLYDFSGLLILTGGCLMILERRKNRVLMGIQNLPKNKSFIHALLGGMIITGFILEGVRISMTGTPEGSEFSFIGYVISRLLTGFELTGIYIYLWYLHTIVNGAFIACLPFSRMFHIFVAPLSLALKAMSEK